MSDRFLTDQLLILFLTLMIFLIWGLFTRPIIFQEIKLLSTDLPSY